MEWLNLHSSVLDSPQFIGSSPVERATWLCLQRFCIGQENGGVISSAASWNDRKWQQLARVTLREVRSTTSLLWSWNGNDLCVWAYPSAREEEVRSRRENARKNGNLGGRPKKPTQETNEKPTSVISEKPTSVILEKTEGEGEGEREGERERKEKGKGRGKEAADAATRKIDFSADPRPHTVDQAKAYFIDQNAPPREAENFFDYFSSNGWRVGGKTPMRDWRAAARNWIRRWRHSSAPMRETLGDIPAAPPNFDPALPNAHTGGLPDLSAESSTTEPIPAPTT